MPEGQACDLRSCCTATAILLHHSLHNLILLRFFCILLCLRVLLLNHMTGMSEYQKKHSPNSVVRRVLSVKTSPSSCCHPPLNYCQPSSFLNWCRREERLNASWGKDGSKYDEMLLGFVLVVAIVELRFCYTIIKESGFCFLDCPPLICYHWENITSRRGCSFLDTLILEEIPLNLWNCGHSKWNVARTARQIYSRENQLVTCVQK